MDFILIYIFSTEHGRWLYDLCLYDWIKSVKIRKVILKMYELGIKTIRLTDKAHKRCV